MKELLYFSASDLMIEVNYKPENNSIHYASHRRLTFGERVIVEQYLLSNVAVKTEYFRKHPAALNYLGIDGRLVKDLNQFHLKNTIKTLKEKEQEVEASVRALIHHSMSNYYFEQIGTKLLELRRKTRGAAADDELRTLQLQLAELVDAYNHYSEKKVQVQDLLPRDLAASFS